MSLEDAVNSIKEEASAISSAIRDNIESLDFSTNAVLEIREKYNTIGLDVLGQSYDKVVDVRSLPPVNPSTLFDRNRLGYAGIVAIGNVFLPEKDSNNLSSLQNLYLSVGNSLATVNQELQANPPRDIDDYHFSLLLNKSSVRATSALSASGRPRTREDIAASLGTSSFEYFQFAEHPTVLFVVFYEYLGVNTPIAITAKAQGIKQDQITGTVSWYEGLNTSTFNFNRMKRLNLSDRQIRSASFGDDYASTSTVYFYDLLDNMDSILLVAGNSMLPAKVRELFYQVQELANTFLAQAGFSTITIADNDILDNLRTAGISDGDLENAFVNRKGVYFNGVDDEANALNTTVFPKQSNIRERKLLSKAFGAPRNNTEFSSTSLNEPVDYRSNLLTAAKRLLASTDSKLISFRAGTSLSPAKISSLISSLKEDVANLRYAYDIFLDPEVSERLAGTPTTESSSGMLLRVSDVVKSLRIVDQVSSFPTDIEGNIDSNLETVLGVITNLAYSISQYFSLYRSGDLRDFLAAATSVSSMTNFLLSDGNPERNKIVQETPERNKELEASIQNRIINDPNSEELYNSVSLQVEELWSFLVGSEEQDYVGRLFDLPILVIDSLLSDSSGIPLIPAQVSALEQLRSSFLVLRDSRISINKDLVVLKSNFGCALTDAKYLVNRLSGSSISELVKELGQVDS